MTSGSPQDQGEPQSKPHFQTKEINMDTNSTIPFGKYKGQPIEILQNDSKYTDWLLAQDWFREKFASHYTFIVNNFAEPSCTPEHNRLQMMFMDNNFGLSLLVHIGDDGSWISEEQAIEACQKIKQDREVKGKSSLRYHNDWTKKFEVSGWDVYLKRVTYADYHAYNPELEKDIFYAGGIAYIEIKPHLSDDYPAVLRQIKARKSRGHEGRNCFTVLLVEDFSFQYSTFEEIQAFFAESDIKLVLLKDIEKLSFEEGVFEAVPLKTISIASELNQ
jgi:hypothetical protein